MASALPTRDVTALVALSLLLCAMADSLGPHRVAAVRRRLLADRSSSSSSSLPMSTPGRLDVSDRRTAYRRRRNPAVVDCPRSCTCVTATTLDCTVSATLHCVTTSLPVDVTALRLRYRNAEVRPPSQPDDDCDNVIVPAVESIYFTRLTHLDLSGNAIGNVNWFRYMSIFRRIHSSSLVSLNVAENQLERLSNATFATANFAALETLNISNNRIDDIGAGSFAGFHRLRILVLSGNSIKRLDPGTFDLLPQLKMLDLDRNKMTSVNLGDLLSSLTDLEVLSLVGNSLRRVFTDGAQIGPTPLPVTRNTRHRMSILDLSDNELREWPFHVWPSDVPDDDGGSTTSGFQPLDIVVLKIDGNPIKVLLSSSSSSSSTDEVGFYRNRKLIHAIGTIKELSVSRMPELVAVDLSTFGDLMTSPGELETVSIHDNPRLRYVDRSAADKLLSLRHVYLHNNNLTTVPRRVASGLESLSIYGNPLTCDCHARWLRTPSDPKRDGGQRSSVTGRTIINANDTTCARPPANDTGPASTQTRAASRASPQPETACPPVVIPLFDSTLVLPLGSDLVLDCRIVDGADAATEVGDRSLTGALAGSVIWMTPDIADRDRRVDVLRHSGYNGGSVLTVYRLRPRDSGVYRCRLPTPVDVDASGNASSMSPPYSQAQVVLKLYNVAAGVLPVSVGSRSATIMWNGTESTLSTADYVVLYRPFPASSAAASSSTEDGSGQGPQEGGRDEPCSSVDNLKFVNDLSSIGRPGQTSRQTTGNEACYVTTDSGAILIRPFLRKYTVSGLRPSTVYEFCMTSRIGRGGRLDRQRPTTPAPSVIPNDGLVRLVCVNVTTRPEIQPVTISMSRFSGVLSAACIAIVVTLMCALCGVARRRYRSRKWYSEPEMIHETAARGGESISVRLTSGLRRGPTSVATYGLPLSDLRLDGSGVLVAKRTSFGSRRNSSNELIVEHSPLTTSRTSLVGT